MAQNSALKASRNIRRARAEDIATLAGFPVGNIVDAMGRVGALGFQIKPITTATRFCGSVLPVDAGPRDNLAPWAALKLAARGDVMMIATGGHMEASVCGDILIGMAANSGIAAVVTDGVVRDRSGIDGVGIPVFAAGVSPNSPQKNGPGSVGLAVVIGGVRVASGDIVCGDEDGVVVVPAAGVSEVIGQLWAVRAKEKKMEAAVKAGEPMPDWVAKSSPDQLFQFVEEG